MARVIAVCISEKKGVVKHPVPYIDVKCHHGIVGDAHAGDWHGRSACWLTRAWTPCVPWA